MLDIESLQNSSDFTFIYKYGIISTKFKLSGNCDIFPFTKDMKVSTKKLKNGIDLVLAQMKDSMAITVLILVKAGSKYENKANNGISHFLEHMCFKGTLKRPSPKLISYELDSIGSQYNAFTSQEFTGYFVKASEKHIDKILDVLSDMYLNPIFDKNEIEKEKGVIIEEINMYEDMPHRQVQDIFSQALYGDTPAGFTILGPKENILKIKQGDFRNYTRKHYVASATKVVVAGDFDPKVMTTKIESIFKMIPKSKKEGKKEVRENPSKPSVFIKTKKTDQTHIVLGTRTFKASDKRNYTLKVLDSLLGGGLSSRLFYRLRDQMGVGYYLRTSVEEYTDHGNFNVSLGCDNKKVLEVLDAILSEFKLLTKEKVEESELSKAKEYLIGNTLLSLESSDSVAEYFGMQKVLDQQIEKPEDFIKNIKKVTALDVLNLSKEIFKTEKLALALIGDNVDKKEVLKRLKI